MRLANIQIDGIAEMDAALVALGQEVSTKLGQKAFRASADLLQDAWASGAPFDPTVRKKYWTLKSGETRSAYYGHLRENIKIRKVSPRNRNAIVYGVHTGNAFWAHFLEFGTVNMPPRPWARPIVIAMKDKMIRVQVDILKNGIEAALRKSASAGKRVNAKGRNI